MKGILAILQNFEGVRFKYFGMREYRDTVEILHVERLKPGVSTDAADSPIPSRRRVFKFWDREGKAYIFKEVIDTRNHSSRNTA